MVTPEMITDGHDDAVVLCTGAKPVLPSFIPAGQSGVLQAIDLLQNPALVDNSNEVVIIGGGAVGCECAHYLSAEKGKKVTIYEMLPHFMKGVCTANRTHLIHSLEKMGVRLVNCARIMSFDENRVVIERNISPTVPDPYNTWNPLLPENIINPLAVPVKRTLVNEVVKADTIVLALGLTPDRSLFDFIQQSNNAGEIFQVGDAFQVGRVFEAVKAGFSVGRSI
jgi:2-enoate reductase